MCYDVLIELGVKALEDSVDRVDKAFSKAYKRVIELRNETDHELKLVTGYPTSFELGATSEFVNPPDADVVAESIEVYGVQGTRNLITGNAINGWCTYTCDKFDLMIAYQVINDYLGLAGQLVGVWLQPSGTITQHLSYTHYRVKYDKNSVRDGSKTYGAEVIGTSGDKVFEYTLRPI